MSGFLTDDAKKRAAEAIKAVEAQTSAEVVIAVRAQTVEYRATDVLFGFGCAIATFLLLWFSPKAYATQMMPVETFAAFLLGTLLCALVAPLRRLLTPRTWVLPHVRTSARAAFYDLGISKTTGRTGILVFASLFERAVVLVPDVGVDAKALAAAFDTAQAALTTAVANNNVDAFLEAVKSLGVPLSKALPRSADDVNELPDEVQ